MSPELEELLEAYDAKRTCPPEEKTQRLAAFERLLADALSHLPGANRDSLMEALQARYREFCRARRKHTTLPPKA